MLRLDTLCVGCLPRMARLNPLSRSHLSLGQIKGKVRSVNALGNLEEVYAKVKEAVLIPVEEGAATADDEGVF